MFICNNLQQNFQRERIYWHISILVGIIETYKKILWLISLRNILNIIFSYILPLKLYLNVGVFENKEGMIGSNIKLKDVLISKGYTVDFEYFNSGHDYLS
jgi:hypothetical protein